MKKIFILLFSLLSILVLSSCKTNVKTTKSIDKTTKTTASTSSKSHIHSYTESVVNPSCEADGYTLHECSCGDSYKDNFVPKLGHSYKYSYDNHNKITERCTRCDKINIIEIDHELSFYYGFSSLRNMVKTQNYHKLYVDIYMELYNYVAEERNYKEKEVTVDGALKNCFIVSELDYSGYELTQEEAQAIFHLVYLDHPELFYVSSTILTNSSKLVLMIDEAFLDMNLVKQINTLIEEEHTAIRTLLTNKSIELDRDLTDQEIVRIVFDYIVENKEYAYKLDESGNKTSEPRDDIYAHTIVGMLTENAGVCDAYSKLFKLFLDRLDINSIVVSGKARRGENLTNHSWNLAMVDNKYYGFDLTFYDTSEDTRYFGMNNLLLEVNREVDPQNSMGLYVGINYQYPLPEIATQPLQ
ncbi:MAG: hypothetical protein K6F59_02770 [Gammaproteobacteria bacterium]|nr:hypothetical protein [Gammaproteobacteria bacterium]